ENSKLKVLGMFWDYEQDIMFINEPQFEVEHVTKRTLLSDIAKIFDPMGFLSPLTILGRMLVQEAWESHLNWDTKLPADMITRWASLVIQLKAAINVPIPRWVGFKSYDKVSVHCFTDASDRALGAVVYIVDSVRSVMFSSKAKVCPIKMAHFTVPRKELTGFSLGLRFLIFVFSAIKKYFNPSSMHIWSDSTLNLSWCLSKRVHKELFIRARVDD
ncbi:unnamed protein product, partial [Meganyctiphanes norvegica]